MNTSRFVQWIDSHRNTLFDLIRIYLGIGLAVKGIFFLAHPELLQGGAPPALQAWIGLVPWLHMIGGAMLAAGVAPRLAALIQIPVVFAAVFFVNLPQMSGVRGREAVEFSALVLFLLVLIFMWGGGPLSLMKGRWDLPVFSKRAEAWMAGHPDVALDLVRTYLGVGLFLKGIYIMNNTDAFIRYFDGNNLSISMISAAHYVIPAHLAGGFLLAFGALTRPAAIAQLPLLLGALFYVHLPRFAGLEQRQDFEFTALVLFLLALIAVHGPGRFSVDTAARRSVERAEAELHPAHT